MTFGRTCRLLGGLLAIGLALAIPLPAHAEEDGLLGIGQAIGRVFGSSDKKEESTTDAEAPQRIAVLPAVGKGTPEQLEDIRTAIYNSLSSKNFEMRRSQETDLALVTAGLNPEALMLEDPDRVVKAVGTDGLVYVDVLSIDKTYIGTYASQEVSVRLRLYSAAKKSFIWEKVETQVEREGGLSLSLFGILTSVITSTKVLTEGVRQALVDRMARNFASSIPQPAGGLGKVAPPGIQGAFSNWGDGPFRSGDEIIVYMKGEPGLGVSFDLGRDRIGMPMREKAPGEYVGAYVVRDEDNADNLLVVLRANRVSPRASMEWRVPGRIAMDNIAPSGITELKARPVKEGVKLTWKLQETSGRDVPQFSIERTDPDSGNYSKLAEVATNEYLDRNVQVGRAYHYRLTPRDAAKNQGAGANIRVVTVAPGPTVVAAEIGEDTMFHALGSPYLIQGNSKVARNAALTLEAGSTVEFSDGASLEILGGIQSQGAQDAPVTFRGNNWRLKVNDTGNRQQLWRHTRFEGLGGSVEVRAAQARFEHCIWRGLEAGLVADENSDLGLLSGVFTQNQTGLRLGTAKAKLEKVEFRGNDIALQSLPGALLVARELLFDGSRLHVDAAQTLDLGAARFRDASYGDLLTHLKGPVKIDWRGLPENQNLLKQWSRKEWRNLLTALQADDLSRAAASIKSLIPSLDGAHLALAAAIEALAGVEPSDGSAVEHPFALAARGLRQPGNASLWIQEANLPFEPALVDAPTRLLDEAASRFARALVQQRHPNAPQATAAKAARLDLARHQRGRLLLPGERDGAYWRYQVAWLLDKPALERDLRLAGVVERDKSGLIIGLLNQSERGDASQKLADALQKQKFRFVDLGQGGFTARAQEKAREAGVQLVVETRYSMDVGQTKLSANLKRFDARLSLNVYDVRDGLVLQRFTAAGSSSDFRESSGVEKALEQAFGKVESDLVASLWRLDEARQSQPKP